MTDEFIKKLADATNDNLDYMNELAKRLNHLADCILLLNTRIENLELKVLMK